MTQSDVVSRKRAAPMAEVASGHNIPKRQKQGMSISCFVCVMIFQLTGATVNSSAQMDTGVATANAEASARQIQDHGE